MLRNLARYMLFGVTDRHTHTKCVPSAHNSLYSKEITTKLPPLQNEYVSRKQFHYLFATGKRVSAVIRLIHT
jgi:hypothetical protein